MAAEPPERMEPRRRPLRAAVAASLVIGMALSVPAGLRSSPAALPDRPAVLVSPAAPAPGAPFRVLAAFGTDAAKARILLRGPSGPVEPSATKRGGGPPFWIAAEFPAAPAGPFSVVLAEGRDETLAGPDPLFTGASGWSRAAEMLYAAWIEALFADADERASWPSLHEVTRDRARNLLHNHLGLGEDGTSSAALVMVPDCADNPYFLRAYFAWKLGLPFGFHETSWGTLESPPRAGRFRMDLPSPAAGPAGAAAVPAMGRLLNAIKNSVHAGNGRTALAADGTDYYPLPLARTALEPGTNPPIGQAKAREQKKLIHIAPGKSRTYDLEMTILTDKGQIAEFRKAAGQ